MLGDIMNDPYSTPDSDISVSQKNSSKIPWLWTLYNSYVGFSICTAFVNIATGKSMKMFVGIARLDTSNFQGFSIEEYALELMTFSYFVTLVFVLIGYLFVWRVNRRNKWALYALSAYLVFWFALGVFSFVAIFEIPGYEITTLNYLTNIGGNIWVVAIFVWLILGWRMSSHVT